MENAHKTNVSDNKHGGTTPFSGYSANFSVGGREYSVTLRIKNAKQGDRYHYHTLDKIDVDITDGSNGTNSTETYQAMSTPSNAILPRDASMHRHGNEGNSPVVNPNVARAAREVNTEDMQNGANDTFTAPNIPAADGLGKKINGYSVIIELVSNERKSLRFKNMWQLDTETYLSRYKKRSPVFRAVRSGSDANEPEENVLYYFSPETITLTKRDGDTPAAKRQAFRGEASPSLDITLPQEQSGVNAEDMQNGANDVSTAPKVPAADGLGAMDARFPYQQKQSKVGSNTFSGVYADVLDQTETDGGNVSSLF